MTPNGTQLDLDAYFKRIGYSGSRTPTLETLRALHFSHALAVPFENLTVLGGDPVLLDMASVQAKIVGKNRGGYCFEVNGLFAAVLRALGFSVTTLIGRVRWKAPEETETNRSHMMSLVDLPEGRFLADIGFGGITMTGPVPFVTDEVLETPHEPRRFLARDVQGSAGFELQALLGDTWAPVYRFTLEPNGPVDYEQANWHTSTHPASIFKQFLIVGRPTATARKTIFNTSLTIRGLDGKAETRELGSVDEIAAALAEHFDLHLSEDEKARMLAPYFKSWQAMQANAT
ncbi:MAG: arylamine N-acetyltransferase [Parvibaculum sp.]|nr:arylamine N-acetyltransferase [Parvibaculum sp.]